MCFLTDTALVEAMLVKYCNAQETGCVPKQFLWNNWRTVVAPKMINISSYIGLNISPARSDSFLEYTKPVEDTNAKICHFYHLLPSLHEIFQTVHSSMCWITMSSVVEEVCQCQVMHLWNLVLLAKFCKCDHETGNSGYCGKWGCPPPPGLICAPV